MKVEITEAMARRAIEALEEIAHNNAGHSQAPYLHSKEETSEWAYALAFRNALKTARSKK